jgi:hypothetical protein
VNVLVNNSQGQFDIPQIAGNGVFNTRVGPSELNTADLNRDGVLDLIVSGENVGLLLSNP